MALAYLDAFSGISGDMTLGAFLDLGMPLDALERGLAPLGVSGYRLEISRRVRSGISATKLSVVLGRPDPGVFVPAAPPSAHGAVRTHAEHGPHRPYREIRALLERATLPARVRDRAQRVFRALAVAEAKVHAMTPDDVVFHEVGAIDAIVDVVGTALCLEHFGIDELLVSPLPLGSGFVKTQHGVMPVPAPATLELLTGFPVRPDDGAKEIVTPTGAAIVAALARPGAPGEIVPRAIGYGAGDRELADRPNLLRVILGERATNAAPSPAAIAGAGPGLLRETMVVLEANVDDMNPQLLPPAVEALLAAGARDVTLTPVTMKKGRPGVLLQVIAELEQRDRIAAVLLRETSTIGVRTHTVERLILPREMSSVETRFGAVRVKIVTLPDGSRRVTPEHDDCLRAARAHDVPPRDVHAAAQHAADALAARDGDASNER
jgi:uncharacterized protein (TIGR00299 family) protein